MLGAYLTVKFFILEMDESYGKTAAGQRDLELQGRGASMGWMDGF